jgi:putative transcriptional regulator
MLKKNRLRQLREKKGISQEKLAEMAGVTRQTIISIEGGQYVPSLELALKLGKVFRCNVESMFEI